MEQRRFANGHYEYGKCDYSDQLGKVAAHDRSATVRIKDILLNIIVNSIIIRDKDND